jgi:hypothetical protein
MALALFSYISLLPLPVYAQDAYTIKERVDEIYRQVNIINEKLDTKYEALQKRIIENEKAIITLKIYIGLIGVVATLVGGIFGQWIVRMLDKKPRVGMEKVDWNNRK